MKSLLLVEDSDDIRLGLKSVFSDFMVYEAGTIAAAKAVLGRDNVTLIILDIELPDGDGLELFSQLQSDPKHKNTPVIFLSSKSDISRKLAAFSLGAEDFISKPFDVMELRARVEARLKKMQLHEQLQDEFRVEDVTLSRSQQKAWLGVNNPTEAVPLTSTEFRLALLLLKQLDRVYSREKLIEEIWGHTHISDRTVDTHMSHLRKKFAQSRITFEGVPGEGYRAVVLKK